jgi:hypothetical protein
VRVNIPANTKAIIVLPVDDQAKVTQNGSPLSFNKADEFVIIQETKDKRSIGFSRGSGEYVFEFNE